MNTTFNAMVRQLVVQCVFAALLAAGYWLVKGADQPGAKEDAGAKPAAASSPWSRGGRSGWAGRGGSSNSSRAGAAAPVVVARVQRKPIQAFLMSTCTLDARVEVDVLARVAEEVIEIKAEEGDAVEQGDVLARLNKKEKELQMEEARVKLNQTESSLSRSKDMFANNLISKEELEEAQAAYDTAKLNYERAQLELAYTTVASPIKGVVVERMVDVGQHVKVGEAMFRIADYNPIWGRIHVPERDLSKIRVGLPVKVKVEAAPGKVFLGKVKMISPVVDSESGTVKVTFSIADPDKYGLRPGMFASTYLITETHENALVLPKKALVLESDVDQVFVVKDFLAVRLTPEKAKSLKPGERVLVAVAAAAGAKPGPPIRAAVHSAPEPEKDAKEVECLIALPDGHGLKEGLSITLRAEEPAAGQDQGLRLLVQTSEYALRHLAMKRTIKVGFSEGDEMEVLDGVKEGERVVTVGNEDLKQGSPVTIIGEESQGAVQQAKTKPAPASEPARMPPAFVIARMRKSVMANPKAKAAYDARLKKDPALAKDDRKFMTFYRELRKKGVISSRRRGGWTRRRR